MKPVRGEAHLHFQSSQPTDAHEDNNSSSLNYYSNIDKPWFKSFILTIDKQGKVGVTMTSSFTFHLRMKKAISHGRVGEI